MTQPNPIVLRKSRTHISLALFFLPLFSFLLSFFAPVPAQCLNKRNASEPATQRPYLINNRVFFPIPNSDGYTEKGIASWYGPDFHGRRTSCGEIYNMHKQTAAHKILPMNTMVLVENLENRRQTVVRINDRGPFVRGRVIDLSYSAAREIGMLQKGTARVRVTALMDGKPGQRNMEDRNYPDFYTGRFFVQIGSFIDKNNAIRLRDKFINAGHQCIIQKYFNQQTTFYRVQVWAGNDLHFARRAQQELLDKGYKQAFVIAQ